MPLIVKPRTLGVMTKVERDPPGASLIVSAYGLFDLAAPDPYRFEGEQALWLLAAKEVPPGSVFDIGMPKPAAELLVGGHAAAPGGEPTPRMALAWTVAGLGKSLLVTGDRVWRLTAAGASATEPAPFVRMPLAPARCFGGEGFAPNPAGAGFRARERLMAREGVALPNIEIPEQAIRAFTDTPDPARFGPLAVDARERLRHAGTYDAAWLRTRAPALAADADPRLFHFAPDDQRWPGYLAGGERYRLRHFSAGAPGIEGALPDFRVRCFVGWVNPEKPVAEVPLRIDTLWLFAGAGRGVLIYRGAVPVEDIEAADVADIMLAYEGRDEDRPISRHLEMRALRTDREQAYRHAFADHALSPARPADHTRARDAARHARDAARRAKRSEDAAWVSARMMGQSGVPKELWPAPLEPGPPGFDLPVPLPEEIEAGEVDLAALLDAMEAIQRKIEADCDALVARHEPLRAAVSTLASDATTPDDIDHLFAVLGQPDLPTGLDAGLAHLPDLGALPPEACEALGEPAGLDALKDWRGAMLKARPATDEAGQLALARARFLGLPEGGPLASLRGELAARDFALPEIGDLPGLDDGPAIDPAGHPRADADAALAGALALLDGQPGLPPGPAAAMGGGLATVDAALRDSFPHVRDVPGGPFSVLAALLPEHSPPAEEARSPKEALAAASAAVAALPAQLTAQIDEAEGALVEPLAALRRASLVPLATDEALAPAVARSFAELILAEARAGLSLERRDLAGADLTGMDLTGRNLAGALLEGARLDGARLAGANLRGATLCGASLLGADLTGCDLTGANLAKVAAERARFAGARLADVELLGGAFPQACFDGADLGDLMVLGVPFDGATFREARIEACVFMRCALAGTDWTGARLTRVQVMDADCAGIRLAAGHLRDVAFAKVRAAGAALQDATLANVAFVGETDLEGARFDRAAAERLSFQTANLRGAVFARGRLDGACFIASDLARANFRAASLKGALLSRNDLRGADLAVANLFEAQFNRADLRGAVLRGANLYGADLADAVLTGADLHGSNLAGTLLAFPSEGVRDD